MDNIYRLNAKQPPPNLLPPQFPVEKRLSRQSAAAAADSKRRSLQPEIGRNGNVHHDSSNTSAVRTKVPTSVMSTGKTATTNPSVVVGPFRNSISSLFSNLTLTGQQQQQFRNHRKPAQRTDNNNHKPIIQYHYGQWPVYESEQNPRYRKQQHRGYSHLQLEETNLDDLPMIDDGRSSANSACGGGFRTDEIHQRQYCDQPVVSESRVRLKNDSLQKGARRFSLKRKSKNLSEEVEKKEPKEKSKSRMNLIKRSKTISALKLFNFSPFSAAGLSQASKSNSEMNRGHELEQNNNDQARRVKGRQAEVDGGYQSDEHKVASKLDSSSSTSSSSNGGNKCKPVVMKKHKSLSAIRSLIGSDGESEEYGSAHSDDPRQPSRSASSALFGNKTTTVSDYQHDGQYRSKESRFNSYNHLNPQVKLRHHQSSIGIPESHGKPVGVKSAKSFSLIDAASKVVIRRRKSIAKEPVPVAESEESDAIDLISKRLSLPANLNPSVLARMNKKLITNDKSYTNLTQLLVTDLDKPLPRKLRRQSLVCHSPLPHRLFTFDLDVLFLSLSVE